MEFASIFARICNISVHVVIISDRTSLIGGRYQTISRIIMKTLQDGINTMISDFENNMQEDARNTILVLKNYDGENLGEFRHNLSTYGAVKVREDGGVETLQVEINAENYKGILELLKKSLIEKSCSGVTGNPLRLM